MCRLTLYQWTVWTVLCTLCGLAARGQLTSESGARTEYCDYESFNASCAADEVLVITSAKYGRMRMGRCVSRNYGHLGCSSDVTADFDNSCSGRQNCIVRVISLYNRRSCPPDFKSYLEAEYQCIKVAVPDSRPCVGPATWTVLSSQAGVIASRLSNRTCPWRILVEPHQRINITLIDFSVPADSWQTSDQEAQHSGQAKCQAYATISERGGVVTSALEATGSTVCGGTRREMPVYTSAGNAVDVRLTPRTQDKYFILKYQAFGCPPIHPPPGAVVETRGEHASVQCNNTDEAWHLTCVGTTWVGHVTNCSVPPPAEQAPRDPVDHSQFPFGILIVVALGVAIGVAIGVVMLVGVLAYMRKRRRRKVRSRSNYILKHVAECSEDSVKTPGTECSLTTDSTPMLIKRDPTDETCTTTPCSRRQYLHSWPRNRPLPHPAQNVMDTTDCGNVEGDPGGVLLVPEVQPQSPQRTDRRDFRTLPLREPLVTNTNSLCLNGTIYSVTPCTAGEPLHNVFTTFKPVRTKTDGCTPSSRPKNASNIDRRPQCSYKYDSVADGREGRGGRAPDVVQQDLVMCPASSSNTP